MGRGEVRAPSALSSSPSSLLPTQDLGGSTIRSSHNQKISPSSFHDLETILCLSANVLGLSDVHPSQSRESAGSGVITGTHHRIRRAICSGHRKDPKARSTTLSLGPHTLALLLPDHPGYPCNLQSNC